MKDVSGYKLVFFDDFDGKQLDENIWYARGIGKRSNGIVSEEQISISDSCLHIKGEYKSSKYGTGWHVASAAIRQRYTKGYFECRCRPTHAINGGIWSAFWIQAEHPYEAELSRGGRNGAELDIFECYTGIDGVEYFESTIHCAGMEKRINSSRELDSLTFVRAVPDRLCSEFHDFGLEWDDDAYTVYMDGVKLASTSWGDGTSSAPGEVILSLCLAGNENFDSDRKYSCDFAVDWVKIWQKQ
jgi:beta-glucanase (GH16 family)